MISIIVPVYNAEPHLPRCIESILLQTYKNFELILVDDGSADASGAICDTYAKRDGRIIVFHTENRGVSAARNFGLEQMSGDYSCFVDADDYVGRDYLRILIEMAEKYNAEIAFVAATEVTSSDAAFTPSEDLRREVDGKEAFREMLYGEHFGWASWGKLYRKAVAEHLRFPEGVIYDDLYTIPYILDNDTKCVYSDSIQYYYYQCTDSLTHSISDQSIEMWTKGMDRLFRYTEKMHKADLPLVLRAFVINAFRIVIDRLLYQEGYTTKALAIRKKYYKRFKSSLSLSSLPKKTRLGTAVFLLNVRLYQTVRKMWIHRHFTVMERLRL